MKIVGKMSDLDLPWGQPIGFVPTMGALHEGHLSLIRRAKEVCGFAVVSVFVNPTQFGPGEDFSHYPRPIDRDLELAKSVSADVVFVPSIADVYGPDRVWVRVEGVSELWEGEWRPGHFEGVATVVAKLFMMVRPTDVFFGRKDLQQCAVISAMIRGLMLDLKMHEEPTVREVDGLALSSRNRYLSESERAMAARLPQALRAALSRIEDGVPVDDSVSLAKDELQHGGFAIQYVAYVDPKTMQPLADRHDEARMVVAANLGATRLIDNIGHRDSF